MAPHKNYQQDLHAPLIPSEEVETPSVATPTSPSEQSSLLSDQLDVVIVQPEVLSPGHDDQGKPGKCGNNNLKAGGKKGAEVPVNCPQLETALFFFGIAGMIVSVLMLLQHIISNLINYS